jgi:hypothetical protein
MAASYCEMVSLGAPAPIDPILTRIRPAVGGVVIEIDGAAKRNCSWVHARERQCGLSVTVSARVLHYPLGSENLLSASHMFA